MYIQKPTFWGCFILILILFAFGLQTLVAASGPFSITLMTLNLHNGRDMSGASNLVRFLELAAKRQPDIIALQEVEYKHLSAFRAAGYQVVSGMNANLPFYKFGNVILTKHKIVYQRHYYLPSNREQRGLDEVSLEIAGHYFRVLNTHLGLGQADQLQQLNELSRIATHLQEPLLIVGDFNLEPASSMLVNFPYQQIGAVFSLPKTFPAQNPRYQIDLIWYSRHWQPVEAEVPVWDGSDHLPVFSRLELIEPCFTPLVQVPIPNLTKLYNPLLPEVWESQYHLNLIETDNDASKKIQDENSAPLRNISLDYKDNGVVGPIYSVAYEQIFDLRDYISLCGFRGKGQWTFKISATQEQEFWFTWEQYYRWSERWGTKLAVAGGNNPNFTIKESFLSTEQVCYEVRIDSENAFGLGVVIAPDNSRMLEIEYLRKDEANQWLLSWNMKGF